MWVRTEKGRTEVELADFAFDPVVASVYEGLVRGDIKRDSDDVEFALGRAIGELRHWDDVKAIMATTPSGRDPAFWVAEQFGPWLAKQHPLHVKLYYASEVVAQALLDALKAGEPLPVYYDGPSPAPAPAKSANRRRPRRA